MVTEINTSFLGDPVLMGMFATFSAGLTQIVKKQFKIEDHRMIQLLAVVSFAAGIVLHFALPEVWSTAFDLIAGGIATTGSVGLVKEIAAPKE